jgi:SAM-dependent methyltransferase
MQIDYVTFKERSDRSRYIADRFNSYLQGKVLDIGCDKAVLKGLVNDIEYTGVDIGGTPDIRINLEEVDRLPFNDKQFDCVICSDVLEHLENLHHIFSELVRVSNKYVIISLPNNWANARRPIEKGRGSMAHYGLPIDPPKDRHKWFFNMTEAIDFIDSRTGRHPVSIVKKIINEKPRLLILRLIRKIIYPNPERYMNRYAHTVWAIIQRNQ